MFKIDRREFIAALGGIAAVNLMSHEARADALEHYMEDRLYAQTEGKAADGSGGDFPSAAQVTSQITSRHYRRGVGGLFVTTNPAEKVTQLPAMPAKPKLLDFYELRFTRTRNHCYQSANKALQNGLSEEVVRDCRRQLDVP
ncbi:MAG: hypothetical protein WCI66_08780 [Gammaproteobacteria bacterium]